MAEIDLRAMRAARAEARGENVTVPITDDLTLTLPGELPLDALAPVLDVDIDAQLGVLFTASDAEDLEKIARELLIVNPKLVTSWFGVGRACLERIVCSCVEPPWERLPADGALATHYEDCQWPAYLRSRPSIPEMRDFIVGLWREYGASLGEAFASSDSSGKGGATSNRTSKRTSTSTRGASGKGQDPKGS